VRPVCGVEKQHDKIGTGHSNGRSVYEGPRASHPESSKRYEHSIVTNQTHGKVMELEGNTLTKIFARIPSMFRSLHVQRMNITYFPAFI
jgi:hypothetical protein